MTALQEFLRAGGTPETLEAKYHIKAKRHGQHPNLVQFKYSQIDSPMAERICQESRGIILDEDNGWACVARAFGKFFNHEEPLAAPIDWATARVQEKLDGSLCILYRYGGEWHVATSGTPDASGHVNAEDTTFADLFWRVFEKLYNRELLESLPPLTLCFELTTPLNRVVVPHTTSALTLIGVRNPESGQEVQPSSFAKLFDVVREFGLCNMAGLVASFEEMEPLRQEGYVVVDGRFNRVKVKHPGYVAIHHAKDGLSVKAFVELVRKGESSEVVAHFPELAAELEGIRLKHAILCDEIAADFERLKGIETQKAFAFEALKTRCSAALFQMRSGRVKTPAEFIRAMPIRSCVEMLGLRYVETEREAA